MGDRDRAERGLREGISTAEQRRLTGVTEAEEAIRAWTGQAGEALEAGAAGFGTFREAGVGALEQLNKLISGEFDVSKDPLFQAEERAARGSLARLGLTQSRTGAEARIAPLAAGAVQRRIGQLFPLVQMGFGAQQAVGGFQTNLANLFRGQGSQLGQLRLRAGEIRAGAGEERTASMFRQRGGETPTFGETLLGFASNLGTGAKDFSTNFLGGGGGNTTQTSGGYQTPIPTA